MHFSNASFLCVHVCASLCIGLYKWALREQVLKDGKMKIYLTQVVKYLIKATQNTDEWDIYEYLALAGEFTNRMSVVWYTMISGGYI